MFNFLEEMMGKFWAVLVSTVVTLFFLSVIFRVGWVTFVDNYEIGFVYDRVTGSITKLDQTGYIVRHPFIYDVHAIDLRPSQVCMNANLRVLNCKLVQFNVKGLDKFVEWHGRSAGTGPAIYEILKSYAFNVNNGTDCPFLTVLDEMRRNQTPTIPPEENHK